MSRPVSRRDFLRVGAVATGALTTGAALAPRRGWAESPNEKLNIGVIGTANRAEANIGGVQGENIVAVCDIDDLYLGKASERFPQAKTYRDYRKLLEQPGIDAVVVSTPDHIHAPASAMALAGGKHVYCEKPLAHSVFEARRLAQLAAQHKAATQMGTQIHAENNYRRVVELIQSGAIGDVREAHVWCGKTWSGGERPTETPPVPKHIDWDLWLGPAPARPYHPTYLPANWRRWWDFGSGTLGDMACHYMDLPHWALKLRRPTAVSAEGPTVHPETTPTGLIVRYEHPARGKMPAVNLTWYDGDLSVPPILERHGLPGWDSGVLFVGDKGMLQADYGQLKLFPEEKFKDFKRPKEFVPNSIGHYAEWIAACKTGSPTTCNFDYSGALTECVLLGNVAFRTGQRIEWDGDKLAATNCPAAAQYVRREYRRGWELA